MVTFKLASHDAIILFTPWVFDGLDGRSRQDENQYPSELVLSMPQWLTCFVGIAHCHWLQYELGVCSDGPVKLWLVSEHLIFVAGGALRFGSFKCHAHATADKRYFARVIAIPRRLLQLSAGLECVWWRSIKLISEIGKLRCGLVHIGLVAYSW